MSNYLIEKYYKDVDKIIQYGGTRKEMAIRNAFYNLLNEYCKTKNFVLIPELGYKLSNGKTVIPDGTVKDALRLEWGFWESKDTGDDLDVEIQKKFDNGYPTDNILFEDSETAVLVQADEEVMRVSMRKPEDLNRLLNHFVEYERPEVRSFREAIEQFKEDLPDVLEALRAMIEKQAKTNGNFQEARTDFLKLCKESIHEDVSYDDVREMVIQHILTDEIFSSVFGESHFHRENNIARQLQEVVNTFFTGDVRRSTMNNIESYYKVIHAEAASISNYHEKQKFLKVIYENFYHIYSPKAADRLGVFYTPNEIVDFMIQSTDYLLNKHFGRLLSDRNVEILDPAAGTGTFVTDLIEHIPKDKLPYKYANEIHANEVAILPYYIANLNIEFTYKQRMDDYKEFENIVFVDTLDNLGFKRKDKQVDLFGFSTENTERIKRQNERKISVIIGNPPYRANQMSANENNPNREYPRIDQRIKETYVKNSRAQKTKLYDMYSRFYRWASDRLNENGILAFISNRSFINSRTFDGFRKIVSDEFAEISIVDLGGDVRLNPKLSGTTHNVFGIQTGVAIAFLVKKAEKDRDEPCQIFYSRRPEFDRKEEKLKFLTEIESIKNVSFKHIQPDKRHNWIKLAENNFDDLLPIVSKQAKYADVKEDINAVFKLYSPGISTNRDNWIVDISDSKLLNKMTFFVEKYEQQEKNKPYNEEIKWSRNLKKRFENNHQEELQKNRIKEISYRPFCKFKFYDSDLYIDETGLFRQFFKKKNHNKIISIRHYTSSKSFYVLASDLPIDLHFTGDSQCLPLFRYDKNNNRFLNITDFALEEFQFNYDNSEINKKDIFYYTYAILHNPNYRKKYKLNLSREFPHIPFYQDFYQWQQWGEVLMKLHLNYEETEPYELELFEKDFEYDRTPKTKLKTNHAEGIIELDETSTLKGVPPDAWRYKLGNRTALEWICYYYKERKSRDETIQEHFNNYKFADYKEEVIDLLKRVCTVSVETVAIQDQMKEAK